MEGITRSGVSDYSNSVLVAIVLVRGSELCYFIGVRSLTILVWRCLVGDEMKLVVFVWCWVMLLETSDQENLREPTVFLRGCLPPSTTSTWLGLSWLPCESRYLSKSGSQLYCTLIGGSYFFSPKTVDTIFETSCKLLLRSCSFFNPTYLCIILETRCFSAIGWKNSDSFVLVKIVC